MFLYSIFIFQISKKVDLNTIFKCFYFQAYSGIFVNIVKTKGYFFLSDVMCVSEKSYLRKKMTKPEYDIF